MRHTDSILPLLIASAIAVVLHAALLPVGAAMLNRSANVTPQAELTVALDELPEAVLVGHSLPAAIKITNISLTDAVGLKWSLYLSRDRRLDDQDAPFFHFDQQTFPTIARLHNIKAGQTVPAGFQVPLTDTSDGPWFVIATAEADNAPRASASTAIWIDSAHPAGIKIDAIDTPPAAQAGGTLPIGYTLRNSDYAGWAKGGWNDRVILSVDDEISDEDLVLLNLPRRQPLAPGATAATGPHELRLPLGITPGDYHLIVQSVAPSRSVRGDIMEGTRQYARRTIPGWNVQRSAPLRLEPATHPDLAPRNIKLSSGQGQITVNQPAALSFDVVNRSPIPAPDRLWGDRVYWSADDQVTRDDVVLVSQPRGGYPGDVPGGGRYRSGPHEIVITPEMVWSSMMYLIVVADDEDDVEEGDYEGNNALAWPISIKQPSEADPPEPLELGRDDAPARVTVAWIAHDDFQDLLARESVTHQPLLQDKADPTPGAPLQRDPEDTGQRTAAAAQPTPPTPRPADAPTPPAQQTADTSRDPLDTDAPGDLPTSPQGPIDQPGTATQNTPPEPSPQPSPEPSAEPSPPTPDTPPTVAAQEQGNKPTSAPRSDREADPTALINAKAVSPGQVLVGPGLEVKTFRPNWSAASAFTIPRNPQAVITFDLDGTVLQADLITSTGYENVDGPLLSSLYRWKATGKRLGQFTAPFQIEITILLNGSKDPEPKTDNKNNN